VVLSSAKRTAAALSLCTRFVSRSDFMATSRRPILSALVALGILSSSVIMAAPASAAPSGCSTRGHGCTYEDSGYRGGRINFHEYVRNFKDVWQWGGTNHFLTNDSASSGFNNGTTRRVVMWFDDANYQGPRKTADPQRGLNFGTSNDKISSACFEGYCK
jgi:hypothetical protein